MSIFRVSGYEAASDTLRNQQLAQSMYDEGAVIMADVLLVLHGAPHRARRLLELRVFRRDFFRFVRADSSAVVKRKFGVAGDSFFEITRGEGKPLPEDDASIVCKEQFQSALEAAVEQVRGEAMLVLKKLSGGLDTWTKLGTAVISMSARVTRVTAT